MLIRELSSFKAVDDDPITERFSMFYSAIEKLKSDLDCLHEISCTNNIVSDLAQTPLMRSPSKDQNSTVEYKGVSNFVKT